MEQPFIQPLAWGDEPEKKIKHSIEIRLSALEAEDESRDLALDQYRSFLENKIKVFLTAQSCNIADFSEQVTKSLNFFMDTVNECVASVNALENRVRELQAQVNELKGKKSE